MTRRRERGFSLLEVAISLAVFGIFLAIVFTLTSEMRDWEKRLPINFMKNPQVMSVLARIRRDVLDVQVPPNGTIYLDEWDGYKNGPKILIIETLLPTGLQKIVWDFTEPTVVKRIAYNVGVPTTWVAHGLPPEFTSGVELDAVKFESRVYGVRLIAKDSNGKIAIDQILQPRAHK